MLFEKRYSSWVLRRYLIYSFEIGFIVKKIDFLFLNANHTDT